MEGAGVDAPQAAAPTVWFSASQVSTYRDCARKWAWRYLAGLKAPQSASQALGTEVDDEQIQPYLREGRPLDFTRPSGEIAQALLPLLPPPPVPAENVQKQFRIESADSSFGFLGYIDVFQPGPVPTVTDTKTCGSFDWIRTPKELETDVQAQLYAVATFLETGAPAVDLEWLYTRTRGAKAARRVHVRVTPEHASAQYDGIHVTAEEMLAVRRAAAEAGDTRDYVLSLPPTTDSCSKYGGCPYQHECNLSPSNFRKANVMSASSILERLRAKKAAQQSGQAAPETSGISPSSPGPVAAGAVAAPPPPPPVLSDRDVPPATELPAWAGEKAPYAGINPPEKTLPTVASGVAAAGVVPAAERPKRHRRTKAEMEAARAAAEAERPEPDGGSNVVDAIPVEREERPAASVHVVVSLDPATIQAIADAVLRGGAS